MIRSVLVDDDIKNRRILKKMLQEYCTDIQILAEAANVREAEAVIKETIPQLVFLDIEMPYGNAFDLLNNLSPVNFEVIFITAFDEHSLKAFRYNAVDYLLKPLSIDELKEAVAKAKRKILSSQPSSEIENLLKYLKNTVANIQKIGIATLNGIEFINVASIIRLRADKNYTHIYISGQKTIISSRNLGDFEEQLPLQNFCRIHSAHIINVNCVKHYVKGRGGVVVLEDGTELEVAARRKAEFLAKFNG
jgi:two-component system, LytTR family, response regulator